MLEDIQKSFISYASGLGNYQALSKTELANGYCDAEEAHDELKRNQYYAALMLRYWYKIYEYNSSSGSARLEIEDFVSWVEDGLNYALKHKKWRDPSSSMYKDANGPDKIINRCFASVRTIYYQYYNKDKRKLNYTSNSIDEAIEMCGDAACPSAEEETGVGARDVINLYIKKNKLIEAFIIDTICFQDAFKESKSISYKTAGEEKIKQVKYNLNLDEHKIIQNLTNIDTGYLDYFSQCYGIKNEIILSIAADLKQLSSAKLYSYVRGTLRDLSKNRQALAALI